MGVETINKSIIIPILIMIILSGVVFAQTTSDTTAMIQLNERLERNKAEILKAIKDYQAQSQNSTSTFIDQNFETLDTRIQDFLRASKRDIAIIMVAGFLVGFALSQVIKLRIEHTRRRALIKKGMEYEVSVQRLGKQVSELSVQVAQLQKLESRYSKGLKDMVRKKPFVSVKMVIIGAVALLVGAIVTFLLMGGQLI